MVTWSQHILRKKSDFTAVWATENFFVTEFCTFHWRQSDLPYARFAVVVSKKVSKLAVRRNYLKRLHRAVFQVVRSDLPAVDVIVVVRRNPKIWVKYPEVLNCWKRLCSKLKPA